MGVSDVITLLGGVALFLYGMSLMGAVSYTHLTLPTTPYV